MIPNQIPVVDENGDLIGSQITDDGTVVKLTGTPAQGNVVIAGSARGFVVIADGGNLLDVDFNDESHSITLLMNDPQTGIKIDGGGNAKITFLGRNFTFDAMPTEDPQDFGQLWCDTTADNAVKVSQG